MRIKVLGLVLFNLIAFAAILYMFDVFGVVDYYTLIRNRIEPNLPRFITQIYNRPRVVLHASHQQIEFT